MASATVQMPNSNENTIPLNSDHTDRLLGLLAPRWDARDFNDDGIWRRRRELYSAQFDQRLRLCYSSGATVLAAGYGQDKLSTTAYSWLAVVGAIVFSTLQMQDMADVEVDSVRGQRTRPLVHGYGPARWSIAIPVAFWSLACPAFGSLGCWGYGASDAVGSLLVYRILRLRDVEAYKVKIWCLRTTTLYTLPKIKEHGIFTRT